MNRRKSVPTVRGSSTHTTNVEHLDFDSIGLLWSDIDINHSESESLLVWVRIETRKKRASSKRRHWGEGGILMRDWGGPVYQHPNLGKPTTKQCRPGSHGILMRDWGGPVDQPHLTRQTHSTYCLAEPRESSRGGLMRDWGGPVDQVRYLGKPTTPQICIFPGGAANRSRNYDQDRRQCRRDCNVHWASLQ